MANLILFILVLLVSFVVVRIGAIAFQFTGLDWSLAKFQALSCFTGTGFTTKESELIVSNSQRRKIASILIVLGNAGLVTMIATLANSIRPSTREKISLPFLENVLPSFLMPWITFGVAALLLYLLYRFFTRGKISYMFTKFLRKFIWRREFTKMVSTEELLISTGGYGVSRITLRQQSPILNKSLFDSRLRSHGITVLAIIREEDTIPNPAADMVLKLKDELICFGKLDNIQAVLNPAN